MAYRELDFAVMLLEKFPDNTGVQELYKMEYDHYLGDRQVKHAIHHRCRPGGLRARNRRRRENDAAGRCPHGKYVGGCGIDWMCGMCEQGDTLSKSQRVNIGRRAEWEFEGE